MADFLPTVTTVSQDPAAGSLLIRTGYYPADGLNLLATRVAGEDGQQDSVAYLEGDLLFQFRNLPGDVTFSIDPDTGELIGTGADVDRYSIVEGQLVYTD